VVNIGLEGMMLMGAFFGIWGADWSGSWVVGLLVAMAAGGLTALVDGAPTGRSRRACCSGSPAASPIGCSPWRAYR
jgi:ABC-type uncharacterized transport system permease subunit